MLRLAGRKPAAETKKVAVEAVEGEAGADKKESKPVEKTMEQTMSESLDALERRFGEEKDRSEQAFALENFYMHGGQELVQIFGAERVFGAIGDLQKMNEGKGKAANLLDIIKHLVPDGEERKRVYDQMEKSAKDFMGQKDQEEKRLAESGDEAAYQRFLAIYEHGTVARPSALLGIQMTAGTLRRMDAILGRLFAGKAEKLFLDSATIHVTQEGYKGNLGKLKEELTAPGREDFLVTSHEMRSLIDKDAAKRIQEATDIVKKCDQEIQTITTELNNKLAGQVNKILEDLQSTLEKHAGSEAGEKIIASIAAAVQKDIEAFQQATDREIEQKTAKLKEVRGRAVNAARPY